MVFLVLVGVFSYLTNPFVGVSIVKDPFSTVVYEDGRLVLAKGEDLIVRENFMYKSLAMAKSGWHIFSSKFVGGRKASRSSVEEIIGEIHKLRFDPSLPFLISGDHFSVLYPRSLGIFYHSLLDPRTKLSENNWQDRQAIYLKTLAYALEVFSETEKLATTIVPVGSRSVTLVNVFAPPSDTLFSMLYALDLLRGSEWLVDHYPFDQEAEVELVTIEAAERLLEDNRGALEKMIKNYFEQVYDPESGLVRKDLLLSGTKDSVRRESAFYDNVMLWKTLELAGKMGLWERDDEFLAELKQRVLDKFWYEEGGYFLEDLSRASVNEKWYSSDWIVAYQVGLLDPEVESEREMLVRSVGYIQENAIDKPFGLQYSPDVRRKPLYFYVRFGALTYSSTAIWSNWGMEYIKLLTHLAQVEHDEIYLKQAADQLSAYAYNIKRYRGYPELYDAHGDFYRQVFYKSVRQTGWVVSYQQAREMYEWTRDYWDSFDVVEEVTRE